jgi:transcriptional regulator with XRE-family HTH domain
MGFRENLKIELTFADMLVKELSERSGVHKRALDTYLRENGSMPSADNAVRIASALGVTVEYLVTGAQSRPERTLASLSSGLQILLRHAQELPDDDLEIVITLIKSLQKRKTRHTTKPLNNSTLR